MSGSFIVTAGSVGSPIHFVAKENERTS